MGSKSLQGPLWGRSAKDWATIQEPTGMAGYTHALKFLQPLAGKSLLDAGCGSGLFSSIASNAGATVTGLDASDALIAEAKLRTASVTFMTGEIEELPFAENAFDIVTGFNSFQYAANVVNALTEAKRVLKNDGTLVVMIWGNKEDCEAAAYLKAVGTLLPPPPPGAGGPFALSENKLLEQHLATAGFSVTDNTDVPSTWDFPDINTALKGLMAVGPVAMAIAHSGVEKATETITQSLQPFLQANGHVVFQNKFRVVIAKKI